MANLVANIAKGAVAEKIRDGANIQVIAIDAAGETDANLLDFDTVSALLAGTPNEVTNAGYARKSIANGSVTLVVDDTNERTDVDIADQTWTGIAAGTAWTDLLVAEDAGGADATRVPLTVHDFPITPDGSDITATVANFFRAS